MCHCTDPYVQETPGITGPAVCVIDECLATCPTCARKADGHGYACEGQQCVDPSGTDLGDWRCDCISPALGSGLQERAVCVQDECLDTQNLQTCRDKGQECVDLHPGDTILNDWECHCVSPALGSAIGHAAVCKINECLTYAHMQLCHENGQMCFDPDTTAESTDDWMCRCPAPAVGSAVMKPAQCVLVGECAKPEIAAVCTDVGQTCIDTDVVQDNTWVCLCVAPETGVNGIMGPAQCGSHYTTDVPETQLPVYTTDVPETQLPDNTTDVPETQLPVGTTHVPGTQLPDNTTDAPGTQLPVGTTDAPETQLPDNTTDVPETLHPENTTHVPETQLPENTTQVPETELVGTTDAPETQLPEITTDEPETQLPDNTTDAPETRLPDGTTYVPANNSTVGEADASSSDSGSSSSLVWLIAVIVGSALVLLAGVCGAWLWVSKGRAKPEQFDDMYAMEANMLESVAMKDMDDLEELVVEDDTMY